MGLPIIIQGSHPIRVSLSSCLIRSRVQRLPLTFANFLYLNLRLLNRELLLEIVSAGDGEDASDGRSRVAAFHPLNLQRDKCNKFVTQRIFSVTRCF